MTSAINEVRNHTVITEQASRSRQDKELAGFRRTHILRMAPEDSIGDIIDVSSQRSEGILYFAGVHLAGDVRDQPPLRDVLWELTRQTLYDLLPLTRDQRQRSICNDPI